MPEESDRPPWLLLVVGLVLVANPFFVPVEALSSPDYVYERATISAEGSSLEWEETLRLPIEGIDCFEEPTRACGASEALVNRTITVENPDRAGDGPGSVDQFVALDNGWYRRIANETEDGTYEVGLRPVSVETVLSSVSMPPTDVPERLHAAARGDRAVLHSKIDETSLVRGDGRYYHITRVRTDYPPFYPHYTTPFFRLLSAIGVALGAIALVRAGRRRERFFGEAD